MKNIFSYNTKLRLTKLFLALSNPYCHYYYYIIMLSCVAVLIYVSTLPGSDERTLYSKILLFFVAFYIGYGILMFFLHRIIVLRKTHYDYDNMYFPDDTWISFAKKIPVKDIFRNEFTTLDYESSKRHVASSISNIRKELGHNFLCYDFPDEMLYGRKITDNDFGIILYLFDEDIVHLKMIFS